MPKVSVYLPDDLYEEARRRGLSLSTLTQRAVEEEVRRRSVSEWVAAVAARPPRAAAHTVDTHDLMDAVRGEFGT